MASVHLLTTAPVWNPATRTGSDEKRRLERAAAVDRFGVHRLVDDAGDADLILFVDSARPDLLDIRSHALFQQRRNDCFVVEYRDHILPFVPGIYSAAERGIHGGRRCRTGMYMTVAENPSLTASFDYGREPLLYSFAGRRTAEIRERLLQLDDPRGVVIDTTAKVNAGGIGWCDDDYLALLRRSLFVLAPRGLGSSSYRLFEAMRVGRPPVILSDRWIPPTGPDWNRFAVFVPEHRFREIPSILEARRPEAEEMGRRARAAWDEWFDQTVLFHRHVEWCLQIRDGRMLPEWLAAPLVNLQRLRPRFVAAKLRRTFGRAR